MDVRVLPYDMSKFFGSVDNPDLVFVEAAIRRARLLGPDMISSVWVGPFRSPRR